MPGWNREFRPRSPSFARVGAVVWMRVPDYASHGPRAWFRFLEEGGKAHQVPAHHQATEYLDVYLEGAGIDVEDAGARGAPLFRTSCGRSRKLTERGMSEGDELRMVKRRAQASGLSRDVCCHTFRATGSTDYLDNGGSQEAAAAIAAHASTRTTQLYDRTPYILGLEEIERIRI